MSGLLGRFRASMEATQLGLQPNNLQSARPLDADKDLGNEHHRCSLMCLLKCQGRPSPYQTTVYSGWRFLVQLVGPPYRAPSPPPSTKGTSEGLSVRPRLSREPIIPARVSLLLSQPPVDRLEALEHSWNPVDCSFNLTLKAEDPFTVRRRQVVQCTDSIRGKVGYSSGVHAFSVTWPTTERGSHAVIGVSTRSAPIHAMGYRSLVGSGLNSWGWDLGRSRACHSSDSDSRRYPEGVGGSYLVPDSFHMILDMDAGSLSFSVDGCYLGPAFKGLRAAGEPLYPTISTVWGNAEVTLLYLGGLDSCLSLQYLARETIVGALNGRSIAKLGLPSRLTKFLNYVA